MQRAKYDTARRDLDVQYQRKKRDLEERMLAKRESELAIYKKQLDEVMGQSFRVSLEDVKLDEYSPEMQIFPISAFIKVNNRRKVVGADLRIPGHEARILWKNRGFIRAEAEVTLMPGGDDVVVTSIEIMDDVSDRRYSSRLMGKFGRDGPFIVYRGGVVLDTRTGLMWAAWDNGSDIDWQGAKQYCENYRGVGYTDWRMPTISELQAIYDERAEKHYSIIKYINLTGCCPWASETRGSEAANFRFDGGVRYWDLQALSHDRRALPVCGGN